MGDHLHTESDGRDRRRHLRVPRTISARLHVGVMTLRSRVIDLSLGGTLLRFGEDEICPAVGSVGLLELHLQRGWSHLRVRVVRCDVGLAALHFHQLDPVLTAALESEIAAAVEACRRPPIVVMDPEPDRRHRIAETLRTAGCAPVEAATPLEAIDLVEKHGGGIRGMAVADSATQTSADELCEYVSQSNPEIRLRRIAVGTRDVPLTDDLEGSPTSPLHLAPVARPSGTLPVPIVADDETLDTALRDFALDTASDLSPLPPDKR